MTLPAQSHWLLAHWLLGALLLGCSPGNLRAAELNRADERKADAGVEAAAASKRSKVDKDEVESALIAADGDDNPIEEVPIGYEDADRATKREKEAPRRIVVPAVPVVEAAAAIDKQFEDHPQLRAIAAQMRQQLKPYFAAELSFAQTVCQPNAAQLQQMKALATPALELAVRALALQHAPRRGLIDEGQRVQQASGDPLTDFRRAASRIVSKVFPADIAGQYRVEQHRRQEFHAIAGATALVAHLDTQFRLSAVQRSALTDSLQREWQGVWQAYLQVMENNPQFFPPVPDQAIVPHLSALQVKQWNARQRHQLGFHWEHFRFHGLLQNMQQEIDWFENPVAAHGPGFRFQDLLQGIHGVIEAIESGADKEQEK